MCSIISNLKIQISFLKLSPGLIFVLVYFIHLFFTPTDFPLKCPMTSHTEERWNRAAWEFRTHGLITKKTGEDILIEQEGEEDGRDYSAPQTPTFLTYDTVWVTFSIIITGNTGR